MTPQEAISYIENYGWSTTRLGLDRTYALLRELGNPQKKLKFIHVAGSNGKGSTCAMLDAILRAAGYKTGLYTSPYIENFCERIQVNGINIPGTDLAGITEQVKIIADSMEDHPSQFELCTAIAMVYFVKENCDIVVLEVGMGGALDSTNAIDAPELAVITNIGLEHTEYLGDTLEKIAVAKAGIIKRGCCCVCYDGATEVTDIIRRVCCKKNVPLTCVDFGQVEGVYQDLSGQDITWRGKNYHLNLIGEHQKHNAALVLTGVEALRKRGWYISDSAVQEGLATVKWPARLEVLHKNPIFILDGGHNPQCAQALTESLDTLLPGQKITFLVGVLADKDYDTILRMMLPYAKEFICVTPLSDRALSADDLKSYLTEKIGAQAIACSSIEDGICRALECAGKSGCVVAFGSLYLAGAVRTLFCSAGKKWQRKHCLTDRRALSEKEREIFSEQICQHLTKMPEIQNAHTILSYMATYDEVDLSKFHRWAGENSKELAFPLARNGGLMDAMIPLSADSLDVGKYGIISPIEEKSRLAPPEDIDVVLVPCVGFDSKGSRIGHGAGYYDRYLLHCNNAPMILVAFEVQRVDSIVEETTDCRIPVMVTEKGIQQREPQ